MRKGKQGLFRFLALGSFIISCSRSGPSWSLGRWKKTRESANPGPGPFFLLETTRRPRSKEAKSCRSIEEAERDGPGCSEGRKNSSAIVSYVRLFAGAIFNCFPSHTTLSFADPSIYAALLFSRPYWSFLHNCYRNLGINYGGGSKPSRCDR